MYEVSSRRCRKSPLYGRDLVGVVRKLTQHNHPDEFRYVMRTCGITRSVLADEFCEALHIIYTTS